MSREAAQRPMLRRHVLNHLYHHEIHDLSSEEVGLIVDFIIGEKIETDSIGFTLKTYLFGRRVGRSAGRGDRP